MKKIIILTFIFGLALVGCSSNQTAVEDIIITDALLREVALPQFPEKIVIAGKQTPMLANFFYLFPSATGRILAIENRSQSSDHFLELVDSEYENKLILNKGAGVEQIAPLAPDLVVLKTSMKDVIGNQIEEVGIPVVYVSFESVDEIYNDLQIIGNLLNEEETAEKVFRRYKNVVEDIRQSIQQGPSEDDVLIIQAADDDQKFAFKVPPRNWLQTWMVNDLKAAPVWTDAASGEGWVEVNIEQIIAWEPKIVFVINYQGKSIEIVESLRQNDVWQAFLDKNESQIFPFPYDFSSWDQPDPRWILGYSWMAYKLYPDQFEKDFIPNLTKDFYLDLYRLDESYIEDQIFAALYPYL